MRLVLRLAGTPHRFPLHYHNLVQAAIYEAMGPKWADIVHGCGFPVDGRPFRLFTFSRLMGRYEISPDHRWIAFPAGCTLVVSSPIDDLIAAITHQLLIQSTMQIGEVAVDVTALEGQTFDAIDPHSVLYAVETLSPITVHSLCNRPNGRRFTQYHHPHDPRFAELVKTNLVRKQLALSEWLGTPKQSESPGAFEMFPLKVRRHALRYHQIVIEGYSGTFAFSGNPSLIKIGLEAGFGSNNAQGFGCVIPLQVQGGPSC